MCQRACRKGGRRGYEGGSFLRRRSYLSHENNWCHKAMIMLVGLGLVISFLLIDDHELLRLGIRFALEEAFPDARILEAESLSSGLVCLQATPRPNLVLLDPDLSIAGGGGGGRAPRWRPFVWRAPVCRLSSFPARRIINSSIDVSRSAHVALWLNPSAPLRSSPAFRPCWPEPPIVQTCRTGVYQACANRSPDVRRRSRFFARQACGTRR